MLFIEVSKSTIPNKKANSWHNFIRNIKFEVSNLLQGRQTLEWWEKTNLCVCI